MKFAELPSFPGRGVRSPKMIVVHAMGEYIDTNERDYHCTEWLRKTGLGAHYFVDPRGLTLKLGDDTQILYHAKGVNTKSIGIEIMVPGLHTMETFLSAIRRPNWCLPAQMEATARLTAHLMVEWNLSGSQLKRHCDVSTRKLDPGAGFDWIAFRDMVEEFAKAIETDSL